MILNSSRGRCFKEDGVKLKKGDIELYEYCDMPLRVHQYVIMLMLIMTMIMVMTLMLTVDDDDI